MECTSLKHAPLPKYFNDHYLQHFVLTDPWVSPSMKNINSDDKTSKAKSNVSTSSNKKVDQEKYKNGKLVKEEKLIKYKEEKGNGDKYNDNDGHSEHLHKHRGKKKKTAYKKGDKQKHFKTKKGFRDKYHKNENHKVNEFWDNYEAYGTIKKFGKKADKKLEANKKSKKKKTRKGGKLKKENKKNEETQNKSGSKSKTGHNKEKNNDSHYNHESQYHKEKIKKNTIK